MAPAYPGGPENGR